MPEMHNHQQQSPEVKQQPGNKTIKRAEGSTGGIPGLTLSLPTLNFSSTPEHWPEWAIQVTSRLQKSHTRNNSEGEPCIPVTPHSHRLFKLLNSIARFLNCSEITGNTKKTIYLLSRYTCHIPKENKHVVFSLIHTAVMNNQI